MENKSEYDIFIKLVILSIHIYVKSIQKYLK